MGAEALDKMWTTINDIIVEVYQEKESELKKAIQNYPHKRAFFEMVRFDFVLDAKLHLYLMEVNMSPNLSTKHFASNRLLYEQVIYNLLRLVGIGRPGLHTASLLSSSREEEEMQVSDKDISVSPDQCSSKQCSEAQACDQWACRLCQQCLSSEEVEFLKMAYLEHANRHACKRLYPRPLQSREAAAMHFNTDKADQSETNKVMEQWYVGKCLMDELWCH